MLHTEKATPTMQILQRQAFSFFNDSIKHFCDVKLPGNSDTSSCGARTQYVRKEEQGRS